SLGVGEWIADRDGNRVAQIRRADRVPVDQDVHDESLAETASYGRVIASRYVPDPESRLTRTRRLRWPHTVAVTVRVDEPAVVAACATRPPADVRTSSAKRERAGARSVARSVPSRLVATVVVRLRTRRLRAPLVAVVVGAVHGVV